MGWNPSFNFKLRDDQVAFGNLIFDKNGAQLMEEMFIAIKNGSPINTEVMKTVLDEWCFTNDELAKCKLDYEKIKEDIKTFTSIAGTLGIKWMTKLQTVSNTADYVIGSVTWLDKYKQDKQVAAMLYKSLLDKGHKFTEQELAEYSSRYSEVVGCCTTNEVFGSMLRKQYAEKMMDGNPNAMQEYCQEMIDAGCFTKEQAEHKMKMAGLFDKAGGNQNRKHVAEEIEVKDIQEQENGTSIVNVALTPKDVLWFYDKVLEIRDDPMAQDSAMSHVYDWMVAVYKEADIQQDLVEPTIMSSDQLYNQTGYLKAVLTNPMNAGYIQGIEITVKSSQLEQVRSAIGLDKAGGNGNSSNSGYAEYSLQQLIEMYWNMYKNISTAQWTAFNQLILSVYMSGQGCQKHDYDYDADMARTPSLYPYACALYLSRIRGYWREEEVRVNISSDMLNKVNNCVIPANEEKIGIIPINKESVKILLDMAHRVESKDSLVYLHAAIKRTCVDNGVSSRLFDVNPRTLSYNALHENIDEISDTVFDKYDGECSRNVLRLFAENLLKA